MWFSQNNVDYVAALSPSGVVNVEKASFTQAIPSVSYNPTGSNTRNNKDNKSNFYPDTDKDDEED